jgi:16S rRNA (cytosine967-C5)-methyltransferase
MASLRARSKGLPNLQAVDLADLGGLPSHFDLLLLDVPCSNTGVLARRLEAKYRFTVKALEELVRVQRAIAEHHLGLLAPNGRLLYSTCSLDPQENEHQVKWIAQRVGGSVISTSEWLPRGRPGGMPASRTDGSFNALIASGRRGIVSVTR